MKPIDARGLLVATLLSAAVVGGAHAPSLAAVDDGRDLYVRRRPATVPGDPTDPAQVRGTTQTRVLGRTATRSTEPMPITGGDVAGMAAIGVGAVGLGAVLARRGRRTA